MSARRAPPEVTAPASAPRLSTALGTTLAALLGLLAIRLLFSEMADPLLIQAASAALLVTLPLLALRQSRVPLALPRPSRVIAIAATLMGVLASLASAWLVTVVGNLLSQWLGSLPFAASTAASDPVILLVLGILVPAGQSALFWVYLPRAASGLGRGRAAWLTALLFSGATMIISNTGISAGVSVLPLGFGAALLLAQTGNSWAGIIATASHGLARLLLPPFLLDLLGLNALSLNWIGAALLSLFGIFFLHQVSRALVPGPAEPAGRWAAVSLWRQPLLWANAALIAAVVGLELFLRSRQ